MTGYRSALLAFTALALVVAACGGGSSQPQFATCGNGQLDSGETCDDGNNVDGDACTQICQPARCGDGVRQVGVEQCDAADTGNATCASLGFAGNFPGCHADCTFDVSRCGAALPPTATASATGTVTATPSPAPPTATPTPTLPPCGDGLLRPDETCDSCPQDCTPLPCDPSGGSVTVAVAAALPSGQVIGQMRVELAYRTNVLSIPTGNLSTRVQAAPGIGVARPVSDNDYLLDVLVGHGNDPSLQSGEIFTVNFERCASSPSPGDDDLSCVVTSCAGATTCTCSAAVRP